MNNINVNLLKEINIDVDLNDVVSFYAFHADRENKITLLNNIDEITAELANLLVIVEKGEEIFAHVGPELQGCLGNECKCIMFNGKEAKIVAINAENYQKLSNASKAASNQFKKTHPSSYKSYSGSETRVQKAAPKSIDNERVNLRALLVDKSFAVIFKTPSTIRTIIKAMETTAAENRQRDKEMERRRILRDEIIHEEIMKESVKYDHLLSSRKVTKPINN